MRQRDQSRTHDDKDRLGQKLQDARAAQEGQWARKHDEELLEKLRQRAGAMTCPHCKKPLEAKTENGLQMMVCPSGEGAWLDEASLESILKK